MSDKGFYKNIKNITENYPDIPFNEGAWERLNKQLDEPAKKNRAAGWLWFLIPLLLLGSVGLNFMLFDRLGDSDKKMDELIALLNKDTQYKHVIIYDTILKEVIPTDINTNEIYRSEAEKLNKTPRVFAHSNQNSFLPLFSANSFAQKTNKSSVSGLYNKAGGLSTIHSNNPYQSVGAITSVPLGVWVYNKKQNALNELEEQIQNLNYTPNVVPYLDAALLTSLIPSYERLPYVITEQVEKKRKIDPLLYLRYQMQPRGLKFGFTDSYHFVSRLKEGEVNVNNVLGLKAEILFAHNVRFLIGGEFVKLTVKLEGEDNFDAFPPVSPSDPNDELKELEAVFKYVQIPFGLKYQFWPQKRFHPYIGLGLVARRSLSQNYDYEFLVAGEDSDYHKIFSNSIKEFQLSTFRSHIGVEFDISKHWNFQLGGVLNYDFKTTDRQTDGLWQIGVNWGAFYKF